MSLTATTIDLDAASAGMILSHNVLDSFGAVLLPAGVALSAAILASLHRRGITQLQVQLPLAPEALTNAPDSDASAAERERQCRRLEHLFRGVMRAGPMVNANAELIGQLRRYRKGS